MNSAFFTRIAGVSAATVWCLFGCYAGPVSSRQSTDVGSFYSALSPYGEWVEVGGYGRVWRPSEAAVGANFVPYASGGTWVNTEVGWSFETDWDWGWAPFHYGRWFQAEQVGWVWAPDTVWGASWCEWRYGGGYTGWRPIPPQGYPVQPSYLFVETRNLIAPNVVAYVAPPTEAQRLVQVTQPMGLEAQNGRARWYSGPPAHLVAQATGREIRPVPLSSRPPAPGVVARGPIVQARPINSQARLTQPPQSPSARPLTSGPPGVPPVPAPDGYLPQRGDLVRPPAPASRPSEPVKPPSSARQPEERPRP